MKHLFILIYILFITPISLLASDCKDLTALLSNFKMPFFSQYLEVEQIRLEDKFDPKSAYLNKLEKIKLFINPYGSYTEYTPIEGVSSASLWYTTKQTSYNVYPNQRNGLFICNNSSPLYENTVNCFNLDVLLENKCKIKKTDKYTIISTTDQYNRSFIYTFDKNCINLLKKEVLNTNGLRDIYEIEKDESTMKIHYKSLKIEDSEKSKDLFQEKIVKYKVVPPFELKGLVSKDGVYSDFEPQGFGFKVVRDLRDSF